MKKKTEKIDNTDSAKQKKFLELFEKKLCNIKATCMAIQISRQTYYNWMDKVDTFKKEVEDIVESFYDDLETKLYKKAIVDEDNTILIFLAKTKMKHRGYTERSEIEDLSKREPMQVHIIRTKKPT
jgi:hypothetical protein